MSNLNNPPAVFVIYLRTRLSESKRRPASLARQRQTLEKWQLNHAELPVLTEYVDLETHNNLLHTDFQRLLVDARLKKFSNVAIERVQCLAQDGSELKQVVTELTALGVRLELHPPFAYLANKYDALKKRLSKLSKNATRRVGGVFEK